MASMKTWTVSEPYLNTHCGLGEGPYYEAATHTLRFVDIKKHRLHSLDLSIGPSSLKTLQFDMPVGVTADIEGVDPQKKILIGGKSGIYLLDREKEKWTLLKRFHDSEENDERMRSNDGAIDPKGTFWIGTMNDFWVGEPQAEGTLFQIDSSLNRTPHRHPVTIPNGIGWSLDHQTMYFTHSTERRVYAFDYPSMANERTFYQHTTSGEPDGFAIDVEGHIWQAIYNESRVLRISPQGEVVGEIKLPTKCITCPVFVGTQLWITSGDDEGEEFGGALLRVDVGVKGVAKFQFKLGDKSLLEI